MLTKWCYFAKKIHGSLNGVTLLPNSWYKKERKKNHKTTQPPLKYLATTGFHHRGYLEKTTMVNLYSKEQSLEASMIKPILWFFVLSHKPIWDCSSHKNQIHCIDLEVSGLLCFLSIILMYKKENWTDGVGYDLCEFGFFFVFFCFFFCFVCVCVWMMGIWPRRQPWVDALSQPWVDKCGQEALLLVLE